MLRSGMTLSQVTRELATRLGVHVRVLPMSDDPVSTMVDTAQGRLNFQEYFVRERHAVEVHAVEFAGAQQARPSPGLLQAIATAEAIVIAPSNPVTSIGPILAVPGIRSALQQASTPVVAVSPFVGAAAVSGPAAELMRVTGRQGSIAGLAEAYGDFLSVLIADESDRDATFDMLNGAWRGRVLLTNIIMKSFEDKCELAKFVLDAAAHARKAKGARV